MYLDLYSIPYIYTQIFFFSVSFCVAHQTQCIRLYIRNNSIMFPGALACVLPIRVIRLACCSARQIYAYAVQVNYCSQRTSSVFYLTSLISIQIKKMQDGFIDIAASYWKKELWIQDEKWYISVHVCIRLPIISTGSIKCLFPYFMST